MSYLKFDKNLLINLDQSLTKEMLRTNQAGAYHCSTLIGCNTRKHHGLLVVPIPEKENKSFVMLSSLDETVIQHGAPFNLGIHRYKGGVYSPNGHKYIREYDCETVPKITYRVGGVVLTKEMIFISGENRILLRYTLVDAHSATTLRLKPFLAFRDANALVMENNQLNPEYTEVNNGVGFCLYEGFPTLYMQLNHKPTWVSDPHWYKDLEYSKDRDRGIPYIEDLWVPGYFEIPIKKGESVIFSAGLSDASPRSFAKLYEAEIAGRTRRTSFYNCLKNSAKQFYIQDKKQEFLMSSYPWGSIRARDTFLALPGTTLAIDHVKDFEDIMATALKALNNYIDNEITDNRITGINQPDIPLWALWAIQQYARSVGFDQAREKYLPEVSRIINWIIAGGHPNLMVDTNGLVSTNGTSTPASWMNSTENGWPLIPRTGYLVEFNALWYNALKFAIALSEDNTKYSRNRENWQQIADQAKISFVDTFLNDYGYLYDYVNGKYSDPAVRPNMAIAVGMDYSPLDRRQRKGVLDVITRELLTPKGLRTLSPKSYGYMPFYIGSPEVRGKAYHNGPTRPWLFGFYADAYLKVFGMSGVSYIDRMLIGFEDEMSQNGIGTISQLYDGNPPFSGHGAISQATNVAEILRTLRNLKKLNP